MSKVRLDPGPEFEAAELARRAGSAQDGPAAGSARTPTPVARRAPAKDGAAGGPSRWASVAEELRS